MPTVSLKIILQRCAFLVGAALLFGVFNLGWLAAPAHAATVTPRIELTGDPGQTVSGSMKLLNEEKQSKTYFITFENFESQDETGSPHFTPRREDLAAWLEAPETVTVGPSGFADVPFKVRIPAEAEAGGHFAAIFFQTEPPNKDRPGSIAISSKLGSLILLTVSGEFQQGATILEFRTKNKQRLFTSLPVSFYYRFQNVGGDHLKPVGDVLISNSLGRLTKILPANPVDGSVLPKSIRRFETIWAFGGKPLEQDPATEPPAAPKGFWNNVQYQWHNFALGKYRATLKVVYGQPLQSANAKYTFFVLPWQLLLTVLIAVLLFLIIARFSLRRYKSYIIAQARRR
jgi:hypothetical protein